MTWDGNCYCKSPALTLGVFFKPQFSTSAFVGLLFPQAYFSQPMVAAAVLVHLVTDGTYYLDQKQETISVQLFDTKEQSHDLGKIIFYSTPSLLLA